MDTPNPFVSDLLARANPALRIEDSFPQWQEVPEDWPRVRWGELLAPAGKALSPDLGFSELQELTGLKPWPRALLPPLEGSLIVPMAKALAEALAPLTPVERVFFSYGWANRRSWDSAVFSGATPDLANWDRWDGTTGSPEFVWPADRAWLLHTDPDACFTVVAGDERVAVMLASSPELECLRL